MLPPVADPFNKLKEAVRLPGSNFPVAGSLAKDSDIARLPNERVATSSMSLVAAKEVNCALLNSNFRIFGSRRNHVAALQVSQYHWFGVNRA